jgi:glycosyltransferase involved in cell wall biosynthesis
MSRNCNKKINLLYMSRTSKLTGPENILIDILPELDKERFAPTVILPDQRGPFYKKLRQKNINVLVKRMPFLRVTCNPFLLFWFLLGILMLNIKLFFTFKKYKTDIVICNTIQEALFAGLPAKMLSKKLIFCFKNILDRNWKKKVRSKFCDIFADAVIGVSKKALQDYRDHTLKKNLHNKIIGVIHDGINCSKLSRAESNRNIVARYKKDSNDLIILNIGNLTELKGQLLLLEAINSSKLRDLNIIVLLIGDIYHDSEIEYKKRIIEFIKKNDLTNKVYMLGYQKDIKGFLLSGDILVHCPIKDDALPRVVLEAFCSKRIVIGTDIGGIPEMIKDNDNGFLCKVDRDSLADKYYMCIIIWKNLIILKKMLLNQLKRIFV